MQKFLKQFGTTWGTEKLTSLLVSHNFSSYKLLMRRGKRKGFEDHGKVCHHVVWVAPTEYFQIVLILE